MKVKELIAELQKHDPEATVQSTGTDCGGYDAIHTLDIVVYVSEHLIYSINGEYLETPRGISVVYVGGKDEELA